MSIKGKILVVDDDRLVLATVTHGLAKAGYEIIDADNGDDATVAQVKALGAVAYLVKPLDITQIVPTVEAALGSVRAQRERLAAATPAAPPRPSRSDPFVHSGFAPLHDPAATVPAGAADPLADSVAIACGVLMHRYSLSRRQALDRLQRMAASDGLLVKAQAERLLDAVELLARPGNS